MLQHAARVTLNILLFKAGPQDFPAGIEVLRGTAAFALAASVVLFATVLSVPVAFVMSAASVAGISAFTRGLLKARNTENRVQQTLSALFASSAVQTLLIVPLFSRMAPEILRIANDPELFERMRRGEPVAVAIHPAIPALMYAIVFWNLFVTANIYRHATDTRMPIGVLISLLALFVVQMIVLFSGALAQAFFGA